MIKERNEKMTTPVIVEMKRTPFCRADKEKGWFGNLRSDDLGVTVVKSILEETNIDPNCIDEVIVGCSNQRGIQASVARAITILSGLPDKTSSLNVERVCISSMSAVQIAAMSINYGLG